MELRNDHGLQIPNDSIASPATDGVLGPTIAEIDASKAAGPPLRNNEILQSLEPDAITNEQAARAMERIETVLIEESQKLRQKDRVLSSLAVRSRRQSDSSPACSLPFKNSFSALMRLTTARRISSRS